MFANKLLQWQKAGYVSINVWNDIEEVINKKVLPTDDDITSDSMSNVEERKYITYTFNDPAEPDDEEDDDQQRKLQKSDPVNDRLLMRVADNVFPSMRKQLVLGPMKLSEDEYELLLTKYNESRLRNFKVILPSLHTEKQ